MLIITTNVCNKHVDTFVFKSNARRIMKSTVIIQGKKVLFFVKDAITKLVLDAVLK